MKISMINIIVSAFVLSVTAGLFYLNRRPAENIDDVTLAYVNLRSEKMKKYRLKLRMKGTDFYLRYVQRKA